MVVQNDPVNFTDPSGLLPCYDAWCGSGGGSGWGGGYSGGTGWGSDPRPGLGIIAAAERDYNRRAFRYLPIDEATVLPLDFQQNRTSSQQGGPCDQKIADIFGDDDAIAAASGFEPEGFPEAWRNGQDRSQAGGPEPNQWGHLNGFSGHIYGSSPGTSNATLYVPGNFSSHTRPSGRDAVATFYYRQLGNQQNVTLAVFHVANFGIQRNNRNDAGSVRIGTSGGPGGRDTGYRHSHLEVHRGRGLPATMKARNGTRQFFSKVFCR